MFNIMNIIILLIIIVGGIFLQIFLSKKENKWLGLILPIITLTFSLSCREKIKRHSMLDKMNIQDWE